MKNMVVQKTQARQAPSSVLEKNKKVMFTGGGTGGSVTTLLAVAQELLKDGDKLELVFVGSATGPEKEMIQNFSNQESRLEKNQLRFVPLLAGKWRRYLSWRNVTDIFKIFFAFFKSLGLLKRERPDVVISAGSFVSVPLIWAAAVKKIPIIIHQQDARPGLANRLMAPFAQVITVNFEKSLLDYGPRAILIGNPLMASELADPENVRRMVREKYNLDDRPLILLTGGRLGAQSLNKLLWSARASLTKYQIIHLSGPQKSPLSADETVSKDYQIFESLPHEEIIRLISVADLVITRAGLGILTELSLFNKAAIIIPLPGTHQEDNAAVFARAEAAVVLDQKKISPDSLVVAIEKILDEPDNKQKLTRQIGFVIQRGGAQRLAGIIWKVLQTK
jgi:UDP-N-acetylglucosamine--N-acetylmuramyl-(pentapeptide) pyrophosphoryl-undecaprenol N-acetylglucosamine transferase